MTKYFKEKLAGTTGTISGVAGVLGSWQVCHNLCLGLIALLSVVGITVVGMPLLFLTKIAIPLWIIAFVLLLITLGFYFKKKCISNRLILINSGLVIAGVPFQILQPFLVFFWIIGGMLGILGISLFIKDKIQRRKNE